MEVETTTTTSLNIPWHVEDDYKLNSFVIQYGCNSWKEIATHFDRTDEECLDRWRLINELEPFHKLSLSTKSPKRRKTNPTTTTSAPSIAPLMEIHLSQIALAGIPAKPLETSVRKLTEHVDQISSRLHPSSLDGIIDKICSENDSFYQLLKAPTPPPAPVHPPQQAPATTTQQPQTSSIPTPLHPHQASPAAGAPAQGVQAQSHTQGGTSSQAPTPPPAATTSAPQPTTATAPGATPPHLAATPPTGLPTVYHRPHQPLTQPHSLLPTAGMQQTVINPFAPIHTVQPNPQSALYQHQLLATGYHHAKTPLQLVQQRVPIPMQVSNADAAKLNLR
eukprot:TRINITY_DN65468_c0_g2_i1.p1 TRINITY_DN65468_c0_g2~~TRINITY_DN65468_c0_g2_i1.p1  ORF type:complete len:335 (+),score=35.05 TRINITY_DN65468_c0_g2_i1:32-1036(+)